MKLLLSMTYFNKDLISDDDDDDDDNDDVHELYSLHLTTRNVNQHRQDGGKDKTNLLPVQFAESNAEDVLFSTCFPINLRNSVSW